MTTSRQMTATDALPPSQSNVTAAPLQRRQPAARKCYDPTPTKPEDAENFFESRTPPFERHGKENKCRIGGAATPQSGQMPGVPMSPIDPNRVQLSLLVNMAVGIRNNNEKQSFVPKRKRAQFSPDEDEHERPARRAFAPNADSDECSSDEDERKPPARGYRGSHGKCLACFMLSL